MKNSIDIGFYVLTVFAAVLWIVGMVGSVIVPLFGGMKAEEIGEGLMLVGMCGQLLLCLIGTILHLMNRKNADKRQLWISSNGFGVERRYGNRKPNSVEAKP
jgi:hypothetical protein